MTSQDLSNSAMSKSAALVQGRIVWAEVADANGFRKLRPGVIVTAMAKIAQADVLDIVAVTSRIPDPLPDDYVELPWHPARHPITGLNRRCAAVCHWISTIAPADIHDFAGTLPGKCLSQIMRKIEKS
jgi:mRNA-degrading endonuclease toxin of MazEF toxin-antitoxin module